MEKAINEVNEFKGYQDVTAGTMIHILRKYGIETGNIFTYVEKFAIQPDVTMNIKGKIYENKGAFMKISASSTFISFIYATIRVPTTVPTIAETVGCFKISFIYSLLLSKLKSMKLILWSLNRIGSFSR